MTISKGITARYDERQVWQRKIYGAYYMFHRLYRPNVILVYKNIYNPDAWEDQWTIVHIFEEDPDGHADELSGR